MFPLTPETLAALVGISCGVATIVQVVKLQLRGAIAGWEDHRMETATYRLIAVVLGMAAVGAYGAHLDVFWVLALGVGAFAGGASEVAYRYGLKWVFGQVGLKENR